jgi:hypothetical protein
MFSFLETGTVHAIGAGLWLLRYNKLRILHIVSMILTDANGNTRELHVDLAWKLSIMIKSKRRKVRENKSKRNC